MSEKKTADESKEAKTVLELLEEDDEFEVRWNATL
jgi:hypothetical protein